MTAATLELSDGRRIAYRVQVSPRDRSIRFRLSARDGLLVTVRRGFDRSGLEAVVRGKWHVPGWVL